MLTTSKPALTVLGLSTAILGVWVAWGASTWIDRPFAGFLMLENGVVASAGLTSWPAAAAGEIFQYQLQSYDGIRYETPESFYRFVEELPVATDVDYVFTRGQSQIQTTISTRILSASDCFLLFGSSLICAIVFLGVAGTLLYIAPSDPASFGSSVSFGITGIFALTALDLYGPYHFFRIHAVAECFLGAGTFHMALVFPYRRSVAEKAPWLIPTVYGGASVLALVTATTLYSPAFYVQTHRIAIAAAGVSFLVMIVSQLLAFIRPISYAARQRVAILAMGTFASVSPAFAVLLFSAYSGGGAAENLIGWAGVFFPISVGYAVLRSDALQVDIIVRRSVTYALLTLFVATSYALIIGGIEQIVSVQGDVPRWISILVFSSFCTFGILPLRTRVQSSVDKVFFRSQYDFRVTVEETSSVLARLTQLGEIRDRIKEATIDALQPESIDFIVYDDEDAGAPAGTDSSVVDEPDSALASGEITIPFQSHDRVVARLALGRRMSGRFYTREDRALLQVLANQGAIAIENALALKKLHDLNRTLENRVEIRTSELAHTVDELKDTQVQLVQAERLAAVGELAAGIAHEVNNPLNFARNSLRALEGMVNELADYADSIGSLDVDDTDRFADQVQSLSESIQESSPSELATDVKQLVEILGSGLDRTAALVTDLRDFASPKSNQQNEFDLAETVRATLQLTGSSLRASGIEVDVDFGESIPMAFGDQSSMSQVLLNVVKNCVDALEGCDDPRIDISIEELSDRERLRLTIADTGPGIEPAALEQVFEPFFTTKEAGKGTGLGLAVCRRTMREYGGDIWICNRPNGGAAVAIEIPAFVESNSQGENENRP